MHIHKNSHPLNTKQPPFPNPINPSLLQSSIPAFPKMPSSTSPPQTVFNGPKVSGAGSNQSHPPWLHITTTNFPNTKNPIFFSNRQFPLQETDFPCQCPPKVRFPNFPTSQFPHKTQFFTQFHFTGARKVSGYSVKTQNPTEIFGFIDI